MWVAPADDGGDDITRYEVQVTDPNGVLWPVDATDGPVLIHRVRGLQVYQRYGFQVRARNSPLGPARGRASSTRYQLFYRYRGSPAGAAYPATWTWTGSR